MTQDIEQFRPGFMEWFEDEYPTNEEGDREKYRNTMVMDLMLSAYVAGKLEASTDPSALIACVNCLRPKCEHNGKQCPAPYTTHWHAWDYKKYAMPTYPEYASTEPSAIRAAALDEAIALCKKDRAWKLVDGIRALQVYGPAQKAETSSTSTRQGAKPAFPEPRAIRAGGGFPKVYALAYTADQVGEYGDARAAAVGNSGAAPGDALDAARYRWLRDSQNSDGPNYVSMYADDDLDEKVDEAMKGWK